MVAIRRGLVLYFKFHKGTGTTANDLSTYDNDGTIYGATWTSGKWDYSLNFDGTDDYVNIPLDPSLSITGPITLDVFAWCDRYLVSENWIGGFGQYILWQQANGEIRFADTQGNYADTDPIDLRGRWHHIVGVFRGTIGDTVTLANTAIWVDGVKRSTHASGTWSPATIESLRIAAYGTPPGMFFDGRIDEAKIYNRALAEWEIKFNYYGGLTIGQSQILLR